MIAWWSDTFLLSNTFAIPGVKPAPSIKGSFSQSSVIMPAAVPPMSSVRKLQMCIRDRGYGLMNWN